MQPSGNFSAFTLHEVGHATFDIFDVPLFGHPEDAADDFATYIMLQFGKGQARHFSGGAAWAWRAYLGDYKRNPVVPMRIANLRAITVCPKSVSIIFCAWPLAPTPCNSLICAIFYLQRGRQTVNLNTKRWSMRSKRKSDRISIRKWPSGYWIRTGFRTRSQKPSLKDKTA